MAANSLTLELNFGIIRISRTTEQWRTLRDRVTRGPLYRGPCLMINRDTGLALDAGHEARAGTHNVLWSPHAAPWQQWRLHDEGHGKIAIVSESSGLYLTAMSTGYEWGETWLDRRIESDWSRHWKLTPTDDGVAFIVQNASSGFALDAGEKAENGRDPHVWAKHDDPAAWQQWIITRLPLR